MKNFVRLENDPTIFELELFIQEEMPIMKVKMKDENCAREAYVISAACIRYNKIIADVEKLNVDVECRDNELIFKGNINNAIRLLKEEEIAKTDILQELKEKQYVEALIFVNKSAGIILDQFGNIKIRSHAKQHGLFAKKTGFHVGNSKLNAVTTEKTPLLS